MRLTVYTDYSLRLLMYAALKGEALTTIAEVADAYQISRAHLMKVAHQLGQAGYLKTVRGKNGGFRLARAPETIRLGDVVRHTEPDLALVPCFEPVDAPCVIYSACMLRRALGDARDAFLCELDRHTLADLIAPNKKLRSLMGVPITVTSG